MRERTGACACGESDAATGSEHFEAFAVGQAFAFESDESWSQNINIFKDSLHAGRTR
jgi:hypothetical protein